MAKLPKKDINLYPLVVAPKKNTMKKGALFGILGTVAVLLLAKPVVLRREAQNQKAKEGAQ